MVILDMRTVIFSFAVSNLLCIFILALLWRQTRQRLQGPGYWLACFGLQSAGLLLVGARGILPDGVSVVIGNAVCIASFIALYEGLARFMQRPVPRWPNFLLLAAFVGVHTYFTVVQPNLAARVINFSVSILLACSPLLWLTWRPAPAGDVALHWVAWFWPGIVSPAWPGLA